MSTRETSPVEPGAVKETSAPAVGFWTESWRRYRRRPMAMIALGYVLLLCLIALFAPAIAGTKPLVCKYKGELYFPAMGYFVRSWEAPIFRHDGVIDNYPTALKANDPESWAIWPLVYQDPYRRVRDGEWPGRPGNPFGSSAKPSSLNWFGANDQGFDVFAQMVHGTQIALSVGFVSMGIATVIGLVLGAAAGYFGGWIDMIVSRLVEVVLCIPTLVLILAVIAILEHVTTWHLMAVIGITRWPTISRLARAEFLKLKQVDFVTAARALGAGQIRIMVLHILRNSLAPILVPITFGIASAILLEAGLSYLGFGAAPPNPSWGTLLNAGRKNIQEMWWLIVYPGTAIFLTVLAYNVIGEGIQEVTDPRLRKAD